MVEPIPQWDPSLLRQIGVILSVTAFTVLWTHHIPGLSQNSRARFLLAAVMAVMVIGNMNRYPVVTELISVIIGAGAVLIPLAVCVRAYQIIITTN